MMNNWAVILSHNNLHLTRRAIDSVRRQDIPVRLLVVDNASSDGTRAWLAGQHDLATILNEPSNSVAGAWNQALSWLFGRGEERVLVLNNDIELRPESYRRLLAGDRSGFVTLIGDDDRERVDAHVEPAEFVYRPHPDFSAYLISKTVWDWVGPFDKGFKVAFCEDWDYHCRMHEKGITAECINTPFYHIGSGTVKCADDDEKIRIHRQAEANRDYFAEKWGFRGGTPEYYAFFGSSAP